MELVGCGSVGPAGCGDPEQSCPPRTGGPVTAATARVLQGPHRDVERPQVLRLHPVGTGAERGREAVLHVPRLMPSASAVSASDSPDQ